MQAEGSTHQGFPILSVKITSVYCSVHVRCSSDLFFFVAPVSSRDVERGVVGFLLKERDGRGGHVDVPLDAITVFRKLK